MTGAELRAWRERLGKDDAWGAALLESLPGAPASAEIGCGPGQGGVRLHAAESVAFGYAYHAFLRKTLRAALEAEEARQSAERGPVEPVCPEGVRLFPDGDDVYCYSWTSTRGGRIARVSADGTIRLYLIGDSGTPVEHVEYVAALSRFRAERLAASDKQRKLDAVRAAEAALESAQGALRTAHADMRSLCDRIDETDRAVADAKTALTAARREAGL